MSDYYDYLIEDLDYYSNYDDHSRYDYTFQGSHKRRHPGPKSRKGLVPFKIGKKTYYERRRCQHCGTPVRWVKSHYNGRWVLFETKTGEKHIKNCPHYNE